MVSYTMFLFEFGLCSVNGDGLLVPCLQPCSFNTLLPFFVQKVSKAVVIDKHSDFEMTADLCYLSVKMETVFDLRELKTGR